MHVRSIAAALIATLPGAAGAAPATPFSVDIMMQNEGLAEALFDPSGRQLLFEHTAAYRTSRNFAWERVWSRERATLLAVDVPGDAAPLAIAGDGERVWLGAWSPSGARAAVGWFDGDVARAGVYDPATGELRRFDFRISNGLCAFDCPFWLSESEFIHFTLPADEQTKQLSTIAYTGKLTHRWAQQSWKGEGAAVKVLGSGAYQQSDMAEGGTLLRVDARTGRAVTLGNGRYVQLSLAPDRRRFAAVSEVGSLELTGTTVKAIIGADKIMRLEVYDFTRGGARIAPCEACNVTRDSLRWSPGGYRLFFSTRSIVDGEPAHEHYIYDFRLGHLERFTPRGVNFEVEENLRRATYVLPFAWLTDEIPAVRVTRKATSRTEKDRHDWYALAPGSGPVSMTAGLSPSKDERPLKDYIAVHKGRLLMMADGALWRLSADGTRENLTRDIDATLSPWCSVIAYWREAGMRPVCSGLRPDMTIRPVDEAALAQGWITFRVLKDEAPTGELVFLNIDTGALRRLAAPGPQASLVTASALVQAAVYRLKGEDGDRLLLAGTQTGARELLHFNRHLSGVAGATAMMLRRREAGEEEDRHDWLLLPPGHREGDRHPLLVYFYPDTKYSKEWRSDDLRSVSFLNQHIPAARGFAVLLASMKIPSMEERGQPMREMHEQLIRAAENVVAQGYADPRRWAIMGHSYGGYGTLAVITQTDRFRAAVAMAAPANLTSGYAIGLAAGRATDAAAGTAFGVMWSEGGQGRMGVPPWQDPQRYIDNSPVFHADRIVTPLLLVHGDEDFVNVTEAEQMFNALHRQGKDAQFLRYWGEGHVLRSPANIRDMWERIFAWLDEHLDIARDERGNVIPDNGSRDAQPQGT